MKSAADWLDGYQREMRSELVALCDINSGSHHLKGLTDVENWLVDYLAPLGLPCQRIPLPVFAVVDDLGNLGLQSTTHALRWDWQGEEASAKDRLLLSIHYDTVYGEEDPFQRCLGFEVDQEERLRGPGVIDAKGGIVILRWGVMAAQKFLPPEKINLSIVLTPDEEIGSPASSDLWKEIAPEFSFAMLYEPALPGGEFVHQRKGTGTYIFVVRGRSAHSGRNFSHGRNAVIHASRLALQLDSLNGIRPGVTFNVGRIRGGDAVNVVPDRSVLRVNVRVNDHEEQIWVETKIRQLVDFLNLPENELMVELHGGIHSAPKQVDEAIEFWMKQLESTAAVLNQPVVWHPSGGASDGNKLAALGLPNLDTMGPEGDALHSDQEWIRLSSLPKKAALTFAMIQRFATREP